MHAVRAMHGRAQIYPHCWLAFLKVACNCATVSVASPQLVSQPPTTYMYASTSSHCCGTSLRHLKNRTSTACCLRTSREAQQECATTAHVAVKRLAFLLMLVYAFENVHINVHIDEAKALGRSPLCANIDPRRK